MNKKQTIDVSRENMVTITFVNMFCNCASSFFCCNCLLCSICCLLCYCLYLMNICFRIVLSSLLEQRRRTSHDLREGGGSATQHRRQQRRTCLAMCGLDRRRRTVKKHDVYIVRNVLRLSVIMKASFFLLWCPLHV